MAGAVVYAVVAGIAYWTVLCANGVAYEVVIGAAYVKPEETGIN